MTKSQAIQHYGSISALAKALGVSYEAIRQWSVVPELRQYQLERITNGELKAEGGRSFRNVSTLSAQ
ncbi:Cro/CI family transcriptional regulator [Pseudomonas mosselii]|uniref:Cro/CI family transcriptional regulator n=1 Tax=Pseudomonas mosselii TaxID=78327 RepID=UPI001F4C3D8D|nr:Cro/CI family transcriptional regulator [Pseudomonas mosselii]MCH7419613.1 Cro/CI family transcriptional regulator [Pseudomonas mosselii]